MNPHDFMALTPSRPEGLYDARTREGRERGVLAEFEIRRPPQEWLDAIPQRRAAYLRLVAQGRLKVQGTSRATWAGLVARVWEGLWL